MADAAALSSPRHNQLPRAAQHAGYGYALWLMPPPASDAALRLAAAQRRLSPQLAKHHPPHATLICHLRSLQQARAVAHAVAASTPPFAMTVGGRVQACHVRYAAPGDDVECIADAAEDCRAVHAAATGAGFEAACRAAHAAAAAWHLASGWADAAAPPAAFRPHAGHISLAYRYAAAEFSAAEVEALDAAAAGAPACCFVADRVVVASVHGAWPEWRVIESLAMRGADWTAAPAESAVPLSIDEDAL
jgi:hypothetical protein